MSLDEIDRRLIGALVRSPRVGMLALAREVGVARNTAQAHLERLVNSGVITGFGPDIDLCKVGLTVTAWVTLQIAQGKGAVVEERLIGIAEVVEALMTTGPSDLICRVVTRDNDHLGQVVQRLLEIPGVIRTTTSLVLGTTIPPRYHRLVTDG